MCVNCKVWWRLERSLAWCRDVSTTWVHMYGMTRKTAGWTTEELTEKHKKIRHPVMCQYVTKTTQPESWKQRLVKNMRSIPSPSIVTKRESTRYREASSKEFHKPIAWLLSVQFIRLSTDSRALFTNQIRKGIEMLSRECSNVVMPFLHTLRTFPSNWSAHHETSSCSRDKLHSHVDEKRVRDRVQVRCSDLVGSDLPHPSSMFDKLLHLS